MAEKKKNPVYEYFDRKDEKKATCKTCTQHVVAEHGNTSNLKRHLQKHPAEYSAYNKMLSAKKVKTEAAETQKRHELPGKQPTIDAFALGGKAWDKSDRRQILGDTKLGAMVCRDLQPLSIVDDVGFKEFVSAIQPSYKLPTRRALASSIIPQIYEKSQADIKNKLETCISLGMTIDHWTSTANDAYMAVTGHFISENFLYHDYCLQVEHMPESHTGANIASAIVNSVKVWLPGVDVDHSAIPIFVVSDNASNMQSALRLLPESTFTRVGCFAHTLQLVLDKGLKKFPGFCHVVSKAKSIVSHFSHSAQSTHKLTEMQKNLNAKEHKLINQCPTRWNSTFYMLERLVEQKEPLSAVLSGIDKVENLLAHEWKTASSYVEVLRPFDEITTIMSASRYSTLSMVIPLLNILSKKMRSSEMDSFASEILQNLEQRWPKVENNELFAISTYLDPRFKDYTFCTKEGKERAAECVISKMVAGCQEKKSVTDTMSILSGQQDQNSAPKEMNSDKPNAHRGIWGDLKIMINENQKKEVNCTENTEECIKNKMTYELEMYRNMPLLEPTDCPYQWWAQHSTKFPNVAKLARLYLCIPATSVPSERMFSKAGLVISNRRNSLKPENAQKLICLCHNLKQQPSS